MRYGPNLTVYSHRTHKWINEPFPYSVRKRWYRRNEVEGMWARYNWTRHGPHTAEMWEALRSARMCVKRGLRTQVAAHALRA